MAEAQSSLSGVPFGTGSVVVVTLNNPREKYWGAVIAVSPAGVALRGVDLNSFEDFIRQMNQGDDVAPHTVFFPMHRVERMELDARNGEIPAMQERFENKTGRSCAQLFTA
jgi:hypothetical protein